MTFGIIINIQKENVIPILPKFLAWLIEKNYDFVVDQDAEIICKDKKLVNKIQFAEEKELAKRSDYLISFGGDGTLLMTARLAGDSAKPILGVNVGKLGFLTEVETKELEQAFERVKAKDYHLEQRMVLEARWDSEVAYALNDFVLVRGETVRFIKIRTDVDGAFLNTYIADGLIVATPTGSTAYSLSANGPILTPTLEAIIINPICPHTLTARPLVINSDRTIRLTLESHETVKLTADGHEDADIQNGTSVTIKQAAHKINLIRFGERNFFEVLRNKLHWGEDVRNQ
ncbi:NAD(+)/NADH kinase [bacterium]|nr:NAD(+)/NADH kinase [bacterium]